MSKRNKKEKQVPNIIVFLVEGESDIRTLELPLAEMIADKWPDYEVRFLQQERLVNSVGEELEDMDDDELSDDEFLPDNEYEYGGDITSSYFVKPKNIEVKITNRFIKPATIKDGVYPKRIARIIQIIDLDGTYIPDKNIVFYTPEHIGYGKTYYDAENGLIETNDLDKIIERNKRKRANIEYLLSLSEIKIKSKMIPYEVYFFSSNLEHFVHHNANTIEGKKQLADEFLRTCGLYVDAFCDFFLNDPDSIGHLGYKESWDHIMHGTKSIKRCTNIDCLIRNIIEAES